MPGPTIQEILVYMLRPAQGDEKPTYRVTFEDCDLLHHTNAYKRTIHLANRLHPRKEYNLSYRIEEIRNEKDEKTGSVTISFSPDIVIAFAIDNSFSEAKNNIEKYLRETFPDINIHSIKTGHTVFYPLNLQQTKILKTQLDDTASDASRELEKVIKHYQNPAMTYESFDAPEKKPSRKKTVGKFMIAASVFFVAGVALSFIPGIHELMFNTFSHFAGDVVTTSNFMTTLAESIVGGTAAVICGSAVMLGGYCGFKQYQKSHDSDEFGGGDGFVASVANRFSNALNNASHTCSFRGSNPVAPSSADENSFSPDSRT